MSSENNCGVTKKYNIMTRKGLKVMTNTDIDQTKEECDATRYDRKKNKRQNIGSITKRVNPYNAEIFL